jgi:hypothetical protein
LKLASECSGTRILVTSNLRTENSWVITTTWRVESESSVERALTRTFVGFAGKFASNLFEEFWPSVRDKIKGN